ncbi:uncharacterized protein LOC132917653 [Rhopalosiphum padi]|uniref:uncharacterized protein LOC132917653 n=1 Tax=Rhopalosiphum padi TaxID=40932 RepID=UPI00298DC43A|nr:uncharacterized protein LOC132917653 [Rhopalosiphum padi]
MGRKCVVCKIPESVNSGVSFHSFPKEQDLKQCWMNESQIKLCLPSYRVCSNHFSPQYILTNGLLKKNAIPSVKLSPFAVTN